MLAHHYVTALELTRAAGGDPSALERPARLALREAGNRAYALSALDAASDVPPGRSTSGPRMTPTTRACCWSSGMSSTGA